jgi:membrane-anchored protein YejM (alkaline phosphatase superfamily)
MKMLREWLATIGVCMAVGGIALLIFSYESVSRELRELRSRSPLYFGVTTQSFPAKKRGTSQIRDAADTMTLDRSPDILRIYRTYSDDEKIDKTCGTNILDQKPCALDDTVLARDAAASVIKNGKDCLR